MHSWGKDFIQLTWFNAILLLQILGDIKIMKACDVVGVVVFVNWAVEWENFFKFFFWKLSRFFPSHYKINWYSHRLNKKEKEKHLLSSQPKDNHCSYSSVYATKITLKWPMKIMYANYFWVKRNPWFLNFLLPSQ